MIQASKDHEMEDDRQFDDLKRPSAHLQGSYKYAFDIDRIPVHEEANWRFSNVNSNIGNIVQSNEDANLPHRATSISGELRTSTGILESQHKLEKSREPMRSIGGSILGPDRLKQAHDSNWKKNDLRINQHQDSSTLDRSTPTRFVMGDAPLNNRKLQSQVKFPEGRETPTRIILPTTMPRISTL